MSDRKMASLIGEARRRVAVAVPAFRQKTAEALQNATVLLGPDRVGVVMDCDEQVFRLGYGDIEALKSLRESGCLIRQSSGLRVGVLVCDEQAWVFAPTALYVQDEVQSDETPNAVSLHAADVESIVSRIFPGDPAEAGHQSKAAAQIEIGHEEIPQHLLEQAQIALEQAPPVQFDIARQVRVFEPYLQYVELRLTGAAIQRHRIRIPKSIESLGSTKDLEGRLRTTFDLIEKSGQLSSKQLESELNEIRKNFTPSLGKDHGRLALKMAKPLLMERLEEFRRHLHEHQAKVEKELQERLDQSRNQVVEHYLPLARNHPPDALLGSLNGKPTDQDIRDWLEDELAKVFPKAKQLIGKMTLEERYKDVTFETLNRPDFLKAVEQTFTRMNWDKPYSEFKAAGEASQACRHHLSGADDAV